MLIRPESAVRRVAMLSVHSCPMALPGMRSAGGMNVYLKQLAPLLAESGVCVDIFTRSHTADGPVRIDLAPRARVIHIPAGPPDISKEEVADFLPEFTERLARFTEDEDLGYDLIHSHYWLSGWTGQRLAASWGVPHMMTFHTLSLVKQEANGIQEVAERHEAEADLALSADHLVAFTPEERDLLVSRYGASPDRVHVTPAGVDSDRFRPGDQMAARARLGFATDKRLVLYVGRLDPFKGPDVLVRAFAEMRPSNGVSVVIVGGSGHDDPDAVRLRRLAQDLGIADRVHWQHAIPQDQLVDYYNAADVSVMPSYHESFGLAALEAMACGTPVLAASVGALRLLVLDGQTGRLVDGHEPHAFAQALDALLADAPLLERLGRGAREWACRFPWDDSAQQLLRVYQQAVDRAGQRTLVAPCSG